MRTKVKSSAPKPAGRVCTVCQRKDVSAINRELIDGCPLRRLVERYGTSLGALHRHKAHIPATLATAKQAEQAADAQTLLEQVQALLQQAQRLTDAAEHAKNLGVALNGVRAIGSTLELLGKISGELKSSMNVTTNVVVALMGLNDDQVKEKLEAAGHSGWTHINPSTPAANDEAIFSLGVRLLRNLTDEEFGRALIASGKGAAFLDSALPAGKPN